MRIEVPGLRAVALNEAMASRVRSLLEAAGRGPFPVFERGSSVLRANADCQEDSELLLRLRRLGIQDADQLLRVCATNADRHGISEVIGADVEQVTRLVERIDLSRVPGVDCTSIDLLNLAGISTLHTLAACSATWLYVKLQSLSACQDTTTRIPDLQTVTRWVADAGRLPRKVWD